MAKIKGTRGDDILFGTNRADIILGRGGNDTIFGRGGNDKISGDDGNDKLFGGAGHDWIDGGKGNDKIFGGSGNDHIHGGSGNDWISGGSGNDRIHGGSGNDHIHGGSGNDWIDGGSGNDWIYGGSGNDHIHGGSGNDKLLGGEGNDFLDGGCGNDTIYGGSGNDLIYGDGGNDWISGDSGNDRIYGGSGNDWIFGGADNDKLFGGSGNDKLFGGEGDDYVDGGTGNDKIFGGTGNDKLFGGKGDDKIFGDTGNDWIDGGKGNDKLVGGTGADRLTGGSGKDLFVFNATAIQSDSSSSALDVITDFRAGHDKIDLRPLLGADDLSWGGTTPTANGVWHQVSGHHTFVFADVDGNAATPELVVKLKGHHHLSNEDFLGVTSNQSPVTTNDSATTNEDTPVNGTVADNTSDPDDVAFTWSLVGPAPAGLTFYTATGAYSFDPSGQFEDLDTGGTAQVTFDYKANDGQVDSNVSTVTITINGVNDTPVADADAYTTDEDMALVVPGPGVLDGDTDVDGDALAAVLVSGPAAGALTLNANGSFTYTPDADFFGSDSFTYRANDGAADSNVATVSLTVNPVNDAPVSGNDNIFTDSTLAISFSVPEWALLANDVDPEGSALDVQGVVVQNGLTAVHSAGTGTNGFVAVTDANAGDSFTYQATDGSPGAAATVNVFQAASGDTTYSFALDAGNNIISDSGGSDTIVIVANGAALSSLNFARSGTNDLIIEYNGQQITVLDQFMSPATRIENIQFKGGASFQGYSLADGTPYNFLTAVSATANDPVPGIRNDVAVGTNSGESVDGLNGNDLLFGNGENDTVGNFGEAGDDLLVGGDGDDNMNGHTGDDVLVGGAGNDKLAGGQGNDVLIGGDGNDTLWGDREDGAEPRGSDIFDYNALSDRGTTGDIISDFQKTVDDIDLHDLLTTFNIPGGNANAFTGEYLRFTPSGSNTLIEVDSDGGVDSFVTLATVNGVLLNPITDAGDFIL